jgi:hypothetical protein
MYQYKSVIYSLDVFYELWRGEGMVDYGFK